jgi:hypothetical protein
MEGRKGLKMDPAWKRVDQSSLWRLTIVRTLCLEVESIAVLMEASETIMQDLQAVGSHCHIVEIVE